MKYLLALCAVLAFAVPAVAETYETAWSASACKYDAQGNFVSQSEEVYLVTADEMGVIQNDEGNLRVYYTQSRNCQSSIDPINN